MKSFRYSKESIRSEETMTVAELIKKLGDYPQDMPVFGAWEGVAGYIRDEHFSVEEIHKGNEADACRCLLIDVEEY